MSEDLGFQLSGEILERDSPVPLENQGPPSHLNSLVFGLAMAKRNGGSFCFPVSLSSHNQHQIEYEYLHVIMKNCLLNLTMDATRSNRVGAAIRKRG